LGDIGSAVSPRTRKFLRIYVFLRTRPQSAHLWCAMGHAYLGHAFCKHTHTQTHPATIIHCDGR